MGLFTSIDITLVTEIKGVVDINRCVTMPDVCDATGNSYGTGHRVLIVTYKTSNMDTSLTYYCQQADACKRGEDDTRNK